jgi:pilus assembly protein CpaF
MNLGERLEAARRPVGRPTGEDAAPRRGGGDEAARSDPARPDPARPDLGRSTAALGVVKVRVHQALIDSLGPQLYDPQLSTVELEQRVRASVQSVLQAEDAPLSVSDRARLAQDVVDEVIGHGPIEPYLRDSSVSEIMINGPDRIFVERSGKLQLVDVRFLDDTHLRRTIDKIVGRVGRRVDESSPMVDARLPDGSRVNAVIAPIALDGPVLTIRKFAADPFTVDDLVSFHTFTPAVSDFLRLCVHGRLNIVVSGGTGSGKTTTLNVMSGFIPEGERIVTIEDAAELQLRQPHVVRLESRPANSEGRGEVTIRDLVRNALRMRPDRIVVGEVRDGAALDMLQAMNTGHEGSITTVHANTPRDGLARLETMVLMAGVELPIRAIREQVSSALELVVQQARLRDGSRRIIAISEVLGMEGDIITLQDLFAFDWNAGRDAEGRFLGELRPTGLRPHFADKLGERGIELPLTMFLAGLRR